jgi:putative intracellular protease/amidase
MAMDNKLIYLYLLDTLADWEPSYALAGLNAGKFFKKGAPTFTVKTCAASMTPVRTMGGLCLTPDVLLDEMEPGKCALFLLPGSDVWQEPQHGKAIDKAREFLGKGVTVAAICGATVALANAGILDDRQHTSNDLGFLKQVCPNYHGERLYQMHPTVTDGNLITASGIAPLEFACQIFKKLDVFSAGTLEAWYKLNKTQDSRYFYQLMQSLHHA